MAGLPRRASGIKICVDYLSFGPVAQLVAHLHGMQGVRGSSPLRSTKIFDFHGLSSRALTTDDSDLVFGNSEVIR